MDERQTAFLQDNFLLILESISDPILVLTPDFRILFANHAVQEKFGLIADELRGQSCRAVFKHAHIKEECPACRVFEDGKPHQAEIPYLREQETASRVYQVVASPVRDSEGKVAAAVEVMRDISEIKALEKAIRRSKDRYQDLFESTSVAIYSTDIHGVILSLNRKGEALLGYSSKELIGQHVSVLLPEEEIVASREKAKVLLRGEALPPFETEFIARDGERKKVEVYLSPIREEGRVVGFQGIASDITLRKQLEEEYKRFARELEFQVAELSFLNQLGDMLMDTRELHKILFMLLIAVTARQGLGFNRAFLLLLNPEKEELEGKFAIGPSDAHEAGLIWSRLDRRGQTLREILESVRQSGFQEDARVNQIVRSLRIPLSNRNHLLVRALLEQRSISIKDGDNETTDISGLDAVLGTGSFVVVPLVTPRGPVGTLLADNAITGKPIRDEDLERLKVVSYYASAAIENSLLHQSLEEKVRMLNKVTNDLRENRDRLVRAERLSAVGEMSAGVAHEIRNPLVAIGGFTRYILKRMPQDDQNRKHLEIIVKEVDRLENILRGILDFVRLAEVHPTPTDINVIIRQIFEMLEPELLEASIKARKELSNDLPELHIDPDRIRQVLINIYRNAIQAMPESGTLTVRSFQRNGRVIVEVEDTGIGIPNPEDPKIFEPFYTSKNTGLGLGLTISSQVLKIHGGIISARAGRDRGTVIIIEIPIKQDETGPT
ncbi:MAG: PAS domain S-box protein [Deltaproteobacteria bacterium]|nr:PAS domain S-box protein [Deltaproteobacteria bacterium]MBW2305900.1 PAS domain S-box protein [Deltaproteobacteria bacterium]